MCGCFQAGNGLEVTFAELNAVGCCSRTRVWGTRGPHFVVHCCQYQGFGVRNGILKEIVYLWHRDKNNVLLSNGSIVQKYDCIQPVKNMAPLKTAFSFLLLYIPFFLKIYFVSASNLFSTSTGNEEIFLNHSQTKGQSTV